MSVINATPSSNPNYITKQNMVQEVPYLALYSSKEGSNWLKHLEKISHAKPDKPENTQVRLLPRKDIGVYGLYPRMDERVFLMCKKCNKITLPNFMKQHIAYYHSRKPLASVNNVNKQCNNGRRGLPASEIRSQPLFQSFVHRKNAKFNQIKLSSEIRRQLQTQATSATGRGGYIAKTNKTANPEDTKRSQAFMREYKRLDITCVEMKRLIEMCRGNISFIGSFMF